MKQNRKTLMIITAILLIGMAIGYFGGRKYDGSAEFEETIDSIRTVNAVKDEMLKSFIEKSNQKVKKHNSNIKKNEEHYKDNRNRIFTDEQLDSILRSADNYLE